MTLDWQYSTTDREDYLELLNEERTLYRELGSLRERPDEYFKEVTRGTLQEIWENTDVQVQVLESIRREQAKLQFSFRIPISGIRKFFYKRILQTAKVPIATPITMGMALCSGLTSTISFSSMVTLGASSCVCFCSSILKFVGIFVNLW